MELTNTQLYLAIGIPSVLILLNMLQVHLLASRVDAVQNYLGARIDRVGDKLELINKELGKHGAEIEHLKEQAKEQVKHEPTR